MSRWFRLLKKTILRKHTLSKYTREDLKEYVEYKTKRAITQGFIHTLLADSRFLNSKDLPDMLPETPRKNGIVLKTCPSTVLGFDFDFDWQYSVITSWVCGGGGCNAIHHIAQVWLYLQGYTHTYLSTYVAKDFTKNHTTLVFLDHDGWYRSFDYGFRGKACRSVAEAISSVAKKYRTKVECYIVQDINYEIINDK